MKLETFESDDLKTLNKMINSFYTEKEIFAMNNHLSFELHFTETLRRHPESTDKKYTMFIHWAFSRKNQSSH